VDCVREQGKTVRQGRTVFGGAVGDGRPRVTLGIIGACAVVFLLQQVPGLNVTARFGFYPPQALAEPWRFLTSAFLHSPTFLPHILFNMYALWLTGPYLEQLLGRARFAALYLLSAIGGSVGYLALAVPPSAGGGGGSSWSTTAVGASGAVFGLFAALVVVNRRLGRDSSAIIAVIAVNAFLGFAIPGIAWQAHLGGLLTGAGAAAVLAYAPRERRDWTHVMGLVSIATALVAITALKVLVTPTGAFV
jgi:membrane associated rhomboid family serine protease